MQRPPRRHPGGNKAGIWLAAVCVAGAAAVFGPWSGCTVTRENYKTLSFFFDGVPDPDAPVPGSGPGIAGTPAVVILHAPYAAENCDACHKTRYRPTRNDSTICFECHAGIRSAYPRMHGPVAAGACLWCHSPHESAYPALFRDADRRVCAQCHTPDLLSSTRVPAHADPARACLECHSGHGGHEPFMLKPAGPAQTPPEGPSAAPTTTGAAPEKR